MVNQMRQKGSAVVLILVGVIFIIIVVGFLYLGAGTRQSTKYGNILVPDQTAFRSQEINRQAVRWLAQRWAVPEESIVMIVHDSEPWMQIFGLLNLQSLSSARILILDLNQTEGQRWETALARENTPQEDNIYLFTEYHPATTEQQLVSNFYSTKFFWYGTPFGGHAIIEDVRWTGVPSGTGTITSYQSQRYLPSITIPIVGGKPHKWQASQTPVH